MGWTLTARTTIVVAAVSVALVTAVCSYVYSLRAQRRHERLMREAAQALGAHRSTAASPGWAACVEVVRDLTACEEQADYLEQVILPRVPQRPGKRVPLTGVLLGPEVAADIAVVRAALGDSGPAPVAGTVPGPMREVPRLTGEDGEHEAAFALCTALTAMVRRARAVLAQGVRLEAFDDPDRPAELRAALAAVDDAVQESRKRLGSGQPVPALRLLTDLRLPVPGDGVPGGALERDLEDVCRRLRPVVSVYRIELLDWCAEALTHCGVPARADGATA